LNGFNQTIASLSDFGGSGGTVTNTSATTAALAGAQVAQVPHHSFSLWNHYQILPRLGAGLGVVQRSDMFAAIDNTVTLPGYARADVAARAPAVDGGRAAAFDGLTAAPAYDLRGWRDLPRCGDKRATVQASKSPRVGDTGSELRST